MAEFSEDAPLIPKYPVHDRFNSQEFFAELDAASRKSGGPTVSADPTLSEQLGAAFRMSNTVGALLSSRSLAETLAPSDPESPYMEPSARLAKLKAFGLGHHANLFTDDLTVAQFDARVEDLNRELEDRKLLQASGGFTAELVAGILDPINLIPVGGAATKAARGVMAVAKAGAVAGAAAAVITELPLQATQVTRTWGEGAANIGASAILGAGLGIATEKLLGPRLARTVTENIDRDMNDLRAGGPQLEQRVRDVAAVHNQVLPSVQAKAAVDAAPAPGTDIVLRAGDGPGRTGVTVPEGIMDNFEVVQEGGRTKAVVKATKGTDEEHVIDIHDLVKLGIPEDEAIAATLQSAKRVSAARRASELEDVQSSAASRTPKSAGASAIDFADMPSDRLDARLAGIPVDKLLKNFGKALKWIPWIGDAIAQGLRNPRLELQDAISPAARRIVNILDENPYILTSEAKGVVRTEKSFSEIYRAIEGGHATAVKEINDIWKKNKAEFAGKRDDFGNRVYFAAINGGVDELGSEAVEKAAKLYKQHVFDPVLKLYQNANLLRPGVHVRGADDYVPWVHRPTRIIEDKEDFLRVHTDAFRVQLEADYASAVQRKAEIDAGNATQLTAIAAEVDVKITEIKKQFDGDGGRGSRGKGGDKNVVGKIEEAKRDKAEALDQLKLTKKEDERKARQVRDEKIASGTPRQAARQSYEAEVKEIAEKYGKDVEAAKTKGDAKIAKLEADRDAKIKAAEDAAQEKRDKLPKSTIVDRELLKIDTDEKRVHKANELARHYYDGATSGADHLMIGDDVADRLLPAVLKARKSPLLQREAAAAGWVDTNIFTLGDVYHRTAGAAAAMGTVFKKQSKIFDVFGEKATEKVDAMVGDINLTHAIDEVKKEFNQQIAASGGGPREIALRQARDETVRNIELIRDGLLGRRQVFGSAGLQQAGDLAMQFNSWRLMGGSVASSLADPMNIVIANGFAPSIRNGVVPAFRNFLSYLGKVSAEEEPHILRMNRLAGAVMEREKNSFMASLMDLQQPGVDAPKSVLFAQTVSRTFWDYSGLTAWTQFWKNVEAGVQHARMIDASQRGWKNLSQPERAWLTNLRIDEDVLGRIAKEWQNQPQKHSAGVQYGAFENWTDKLAASRFADALSRESKNVVVTPTAGDRLAFQHTPFGRMAGQFRSYGISASGRLLARNAALNGMDGEKTGAFYTGLFGLAMMAAVVDGVKFMLGDMALDGSSKKDPSRSALDRLIEKWEKTPGEQLYNVLDRSGVMMPLTEPSNIMQKMGLPNMQGAFSMLARDEKDLRAGSSRYMHRTVAEAAFGPTVGLLEDIVGAGRIGSAGFGYMVGLNEEFNMSSADFSRLRRLAPFQNVPIVQQGINYGHQHLGTIFDWPTE